VPDPQFVNQALDLLDKAFARGVGLDKAATDPDLAALKALPRFGALVARHRSGASRE
jgi:hypothetical protein